MKPKLYVETTIVGYLTKRASRDVVTAANQKITRQWWEKRRGAFELYCSEVVVEEAGAGNKEQANERLSHLAGMPVLLWSPEARDLAKVLVKRKALPLKASDDAGHLAIAAVAGMSYLLTWNYRHLVNASLRKLMEQVCEKAGYRCPLVCTPAELLESPSWRTKS